MMASGLTSANAQTSNTADPSEGTTGATAKTSSALEEVMVTARRRVEPLQSVPVAVTALSGADLAQHEITTVQDLSRLVPSLSVAPSQGIRSSPTYAIRGERNLNPKLSLDPAVEVYFAGIALARPYGTNDAFYDIASVQVLRGPQGTLFGRNSTGGAVLIEPKAPSDKFEGYYEQEIGNYSDFVESGAVNLPLTQRLSVRVAGRIAKRNGWGRNIDTGQDLDNLNNQSWRVSVNYDITDNLTNLLVYDGYHANEAGSLTIPEAVRPNFPDTTKFWNAWLAKQQTLGFYTVAIDANLFEKLNVNGISNTTTLSLGNATVKNIFGYRKTIHTGLESSDGGDAPNHAVLLGQDQDITQYSEEFQILGTAFEKSLDWIGGAYYFKESGFDFGPVTGGASADINLGGDARAVSEAGYAQVTWRPEFMPKLSLTGGGRMTWDQRWSALESNDLHGGCIVRGASGAVVSPCYFPISKNFSDPTWTFAADYKVLPATLIYATVRTGYRSGGVKVSVSRPNLATFKPEKDLDVETGVKSDWSLLGMPVRTNIGLFKDFLTDVQRTVFIATLTSQATTVNVGRADVQGVEVEATIIPFEGLSLSGTFSVDDMKYLTPFVTSNGDHTGDPFALSPKIQYSLSASYVHPLPGELGNAGFDLNYSHQSAITFNEEASPIGHWPGQGLMNGSISVDDIAGTQFGLKVWVHNLLNTKYVVGGNDQYYSRGYFSVTPGEPRMYGLTAHVDF
jgi:iron complex outermembrane receptor protein